LPGIVSGLRIGTALIVIGVVVSEMLASFDGIGFWISSNRSTFNTPEVYLGIVLALAISISVSAALSRLERHFGAWREAERGRSSADARMRASNF
jgi:NitT/TauT family transport system permease protein/taurine transport system permease protein